MKIAILGYDTEGRVSYEYFASQGHEVTICDQKTDVELPEGADFALGEHYLDDLDRFDLLVRTAGMPPHVILEKNPGVQDKITSHVNEFFKACPTKNVIGVTGTKGKGTTSTLIAKMLEQCGKDVYLGGNIGLPPITFLNKLTEDSWVVLELSSFQLMDIKYSPNIAVCLMVVPEHLNWHSDMNEYKLAKSNLFANQLSTDTAIYLSTNPISKEIASVGQGVKLPYFNPPGAHVDNGQIVIDETTICEVAEIKLLGEHNWQNACAAVTTVWQVEKNSEAIKSVLTTFSGLEHRLEFVRELDGIKYFDDSFGTTPETAIVALKSFTEPKVAILGGSDKGASYDDLAQVVATSNVKKVLLIGEQADRIESALAKAGYHNFTEGGRNMKEIVNNAHTVAETGDIVLLSTACASFGMFENYKDRGNQFKKAVSELS